ncbi:hypothetical protein HDU96_000904 [Phlyctochytrium bullatum]|nr:hypothetical protein HDU96_000904 [Phlyctochytrium bullatum]
MNAARTTTPSRSRSLPVSTYRDLLNLNAHWHHPAPVPQDRYRALVLSTAKLLIREYESKHSQHLHFHPSTMPLSHTRKLIRQLLTLRLPNPDDADPDHPEAKKNDPVVFDNMDALLATEALVHPPVPATSFLPALTVAGDSRVSLYRGDITRLQADFVVNAANAQLLGCFQPPHLCIDNVIHAAAGPRLRHDCANLVAAHAYEETPGGAVVTRGYALPARWVVHTVGPCIDDRNRNKPGYVPPRALQDQLRNCYVNSLDAAQEVVGDGDDEVSIAFCCVATGLFGFPQDLAARIAVEEVTAWLARVPRGTRRWHVVFNVFTDKDEALYRDLLASLATHPVPVNSPATSGTVSAALAQAKSLIDSADYLLVSAGAGLSAAAGLDYTSETVFKRHHPAMHARGFRRMYEFIGFNDWTERLKWGYLFRQTHLARFAWPSHPVYENLKRLVETRFGGDRAFVVTSNADGMFVQRGFEAERVYTPQGDYSLLQCLRPCRSDSVWDAKPVVEAALPFIDPRTGELTRDDLVPRCPRCGGEAMLNVRGGRWFLETPHEARRRAYDEWVGRVVREVREEGKRLVVLEIGAGFNTPGVLRWPNEELAEMSGVALVRVNEGDAEVPVGLGGSVGVAMDATEALERLCA